MTSSSDANSQNDQLDNLSEADLAQAFQELQRGEKTAQAMEANLSSLEKKIDDLLATFDDKQLAQLEELESATAKKNESAAAGAKTDGQERKD